jgi:hypothetical protein
MNAQLSGAKQRWQSWLETVTDERSECLKSACSATCRRLRRDGGGRRRGPFPAVAGTALERSRGPDLGATSLTEDVALHLAAGRLGQRVDEVHAARVGVRGELPLDQLLQFGGEQLVPGVVRAKDDEGLQDLAAQIIGPPMTAVSITRGWVTRTLSTSKGPIR